jgi:hypothetical protein
MPIMLAEVADYNDWGRVVGSDITKHHANWGGYTLNAHYAVENGTTSLIYYSAVRDGASTPDYYIDADGFNRFVDNVTVFRTAADFIYLNSKRGSLSLSALQRLTGVAVRDPRMLLASLATEWHESLSDPGYYFYLIGIAGYTLSSPVGTLARRLDIWQRISRYTRASLLNVVRNPRLREAINQIYKSTARIGTGSTADIVRMELRHGIRLSKTGHATKGRNNINRLRTILREETLTPEEQQVAISFSTLSKLCKVADSLRHTI